MATVNPSTGAEIARVSAGLSADVDAAVECARNAFTTWSQTPGEKRGHLLRRYGDLILANQETLARLEGLDNGMSVVLGRGVVFQAAQWVYYYAGWADKLEGTTHNDLLDRRLFTYTVRQPYGVVGAIVPWNFPIALLVWKLAPALACGNTLVIKPSEKTPLTALALADLAMRAGFPPGVVNVVLGLGTTAGDALARHPHVDKISFTGSTGVGRAILRAAAETNLKRVTLELGGKSPVIVMPDADLDEAVAFAHSGLFINQGQFCAAGSRVIVHEDVYEEFLAKSAELARKRRARVGHALDEKATHGPVVDQLQYNRVLEYIEAGKRDGARVVVGGERVAAHKDESIRGGFYIEPTIFADVEPRMRIAQEEIFGPVMAVIKVRSVQEAIAVANQTEYGLAAGVFCRDIKSALAIAHAVHAGTVWVNTYGKMMPQAAFGGMKLSGIGTENGEAVLREYSHSKTVTMALAKL